MVTALAFHPYGPGSIFRPTVTCRLSLLVLYSALRCFSRGYSGFLLSLKTNIWFDLLWLSLICSILNKKSLCARLTPLSDYYYSFNLQNLTLLKTGDQLLYWTPTVKSLQIDSKIYFQKLINRDQTGFLKGRFTGENIRLIDGLINHSTPHNIAGLLIFLDFGKAFDAVWMVF